MCVCMNKRVLCMNKRSVCVYLCVCLLMKSRRFRRFRIVFVVCSVLQLLFLRGCAYAYVVMFVVVVMLGGGDRSGWKAL